MATLQEIWEFALDEHNKIRRKHGVAYDILGEEAIHENAQKYAEHLAASNKFEAATLGKYACNLAMSSRVNLWDGIKDCINRLYDGNNYYLNPKVSKMGIGVTRNDHQNRWVVVFFYEVPGMRDFSKSW